MAYRHEGFWQPMDTQRDKNHLEELWTAGKAPWKVWFWFMAFVIAVRDNPVNLAKAMSNLYRDWETDRKSVV